MNKRKKVEETRELFRHWASLRDDLGMAARMGLEAIEYLESENETRIEGWFNYEEWKYSHSEPTDFWGSDDAHADGPPPVGGPYRKVTMIVHKKGEE